MTLDFRYRGQLAPKYKSRYDRVVHRISQPFTCVIDAISKRQYGNMSWWVSSPASRNILLSPLFTYCSFLSLLHELVEDRIEITKILTDSRALGKILSAYLEANNLCVEICLYPRPKKRIRKRLCNVVRTPFHHLCLHIWIRWIRRFRGGRPKPGATLIDVFVVPNHVEDDRYYSGLMEELTDAEWKNIWFVPCFSGFSRRQLYSAIPTLYESSRNILLKECYLHISDYVFAWYQTFRSRCIKVGEVSFLGFDITTLVHEELGDGRGFPSAFTAMLNYRFPKRLRLAGIRPECVINWFENQCIDKGWNAGFRRFYPKIAVKGYQGFVIPGNYIWLSPSCEETTGGVIPRQIAVVGKGMIPIIKRFCSELNVNIGPALRYRQVWKSRVQYPGYFFFTIVVPLHLVLGEIRRMLRMLIGVQSKLNDPRIRWWIKPHPGMSAEKVRRAIKEPWPGNFTFIDGDFRPWLEQSHLLISNTSSTCLESLAKGVPVVILGNPTGVTFNPIPETVSEEIWRLCHSENDLMDAIKYFRRNYSSKRNQYEKIGLQIRAHYFEPVTPIAARRLISEY
jgi:hypothetical protein